MAPPSKKRKTQTAEEITFDATAREDYLTGFHKRKQARIKHAQEEAAKKEREERIRERKRIRDQRKEDLEKHVETVNALLRKAIENTSDGSDAENLGEEGEEWEGFEEPQTINHEDEYVDEDKYTTVTVESVGISRDGFHHTGDSTENEEQGSSDGHVKGDTSSAKGENPGEKEQAGKNKKVWTKERPKSDKPKKKKKKFRYESPAERKFMRMKERSKNKSQAQARRTK